MEKSTKSEKIIIGICLGIIMFFMISILVRFFTRQILVKRMGIDNEFTRLVWFDNEAIREFSEEDQLKESAKSIEWTDMFPFDDNESALLINNGAVNQSRLIMMCDKVTNIVNSVEEKIDSYSSSLLVGYQKMVELSKQYSQLIGWNIASYGEYNGIVTMSDGYLTQYISKRDMTSAVDAVSEFASWCESEGCKFLYVMSPYKISEYEDSDISGTLDYSNQNANEFIIGLSEKGIECLDLRKIIHEQGIHNHSLFYKTDHHWLTSS